MAKPTSENLPGAADRRGRVWLAGILTFAALARLLYLLVYLRSDPLAGYLLHDALRYHEMADALARGQGWPPGPFYQAPLYPWLLSVVYRAFGPQPVAVYALQSLLGLALIPLVERIARRAYGRRAGLAAAALTALYGVLPFHETKLLPGALSALLAALAVDRLQRAGERHGLAGWMTAGAVIGLGALGSPALLLLVPMVLGWMLFDRDLSAGSRVAAVFLLGVVLPIAPVTVRNAVVGGELVPISSNAGINFWLGNNPEAQGVMSTPPGFTGSIFTQREESRTLAEREAGRPLTQSEVSRHWLGRGLVFARDHPLRWLQLELLKLGLALDDYEHALEYNPQLDANPVRWLMPLPFAVVLALAALRGFAARRWSRAETPLMLVLAATLGTLLLFFVSSRFRLPALPSLLALAGCGAVTLWNRLRAGPRVAIAPALTAALVAAVSLFHAPLRLPDLRATEEARGLCDLGLAQLASGNAERAIELYRAAARLDPDDPFAALDLGKALAAHGDRAGAERAIRRSIQLAPRLAEAHYDLGVLLNETGRPTEAAEAFSRAFEIDPRDARAANNLLGTLLGSGQTERAVEVWREMKRRELPVDEPLERWMRAAGVTP